MASDNRPDPDELLRAILRHEAAGPKGKLHVFFGMAAGVGKTYAMLEAARARKAEDLDVVVGLVETHGRTETEALLRGLELLPRKSIAYRGVTLHELDIDALLLRKPQVAIVDELAHTNAPGSRHPKRWQDVVELLDANIDVYTTINVQHVESRKETVASITGLPVTETVPDALLERAAEIRLVDITPSELLKRLKEGKVYLGERADAAAANFFKEDRLTALREIALRMTAEKVDSDLHELLLTSGGAEAWKPRERLMVAVSHSPFSEGLIRATRRIAFNLDAPWIAAHVDVGHPMTEVDSERLARNLRLVQELGGELITTADTDIAEALSRVARQQRVTQLVVGRSERRWYHAFSGGSMIDKLAKETRSLDLIVLRAEATHSPGPERPQVRSWAWPSWNQSMLAVAAVIAAALLSYLALPVIGYKAAGFVFLLVVLGISLFMTIGAVIIAAALSALIWDYLFIHPFGTLYIAQTEDVMMVISYAVAALVTGTLIHRIRARQRLLRQREDRTVLLYDLAKDLVGHVHLADSVTLLDQRMQSLGLGDIDLLIPNSDGSLSLPSLLNKPWLQGEKEVAVAQWAFRHSRIAGWGTDTLPSAAARSLPLRTVTGQAIGVLAVHPVQGRHPSQDEENLLLAIAHQLALSAERSRLSDEAAHVAQARESDRLVQTIIDSVSHELRTPLTAIAGSASLLTSPEFLVDPVRRDQVADDLLATVERLNGVVSNLLDMSRLSAQGLTLQRDWHDVFDVVTQALEASRRRLRQHAVKLLYEEKLPLLRLDFKLLEQAITNLLDNAATYTPPGSQIDIRLSANDTKVTLAVTDNGPGIAPEALPRLFDKFYRAPGSPAGGTGLGLAITKAIIEAHGGTISAENAPQGGAVFTISLPAEAQPEVPRESEP